MRPGELISNSIRRVTQLRQFSRSPLERSNLQVRRRPADDELDGDVAGAIDLAVREWTCFHDIWFVELTVAPRPGGPTAQFAQVVFSSCSVRFPIVRGGPTRVALPVPATHRQKDVGLAIELSDGRTVVDWQPGLRALVGDPAARLFRRFAAELDARPTGAVLEIGARARSGIVHRDIVPTGWTYVGMDISDGPNVDVVGDAHDLAVVMGDRRFDAIYSVSVFEHLLIPWRVVLEINQVLKPDGLVFVATHQSFPLHDEPWDFWRFSDRAWAGLFNASTGFELLDTAMGEEATIVPRAVNASWETGEPAYLLSCALARKIGDATITWPVEATGLVTSGYPH